MFATRNSPVDHRTNPLSRIVRIGKNNDATFFLRMADLLQNSFINSRPIRFDRIGIDSLFDFGSIVAPFNNRSEEHTSELQSRFDLVCRLLLEKKKERLNDVV